MNKISLSVAGLLLLAGCSAQHHTAQLHSTNERAMTVGIVQKEIRQGMSQADVAQALGSPNIVSSDNQGDETWIYDKIASEASYSNSSVNANAAAGAGGLIGHALLLGGVGLGGSQASGASSTTQKTLTVIIKFNKEKAVKSFSYHSSKF